MKTKNLLLNCLIALILSNPLLILKAQSPSEKPNFIIILMDDLGYNDFSCYGATDLSTPNIDAMANQGVKFSSFYVSPVCSPTRASLMTGCYSQRVGIGGVLFERNKNGLHSDEITIAELLKAQGYSTALIGKWHLGPFKDLYPTTQGFDYWYGTISSNNTNLDPKNSTYATDCLFRDGFTKETLLEEDRVECALLKNNEVIEVPTDQELFTSRYTDETINFIKENKDNPFFIYLSHNMPHIPLHASSSFVGTSARGVYGDVVQELDWSVGEIFKTLKQEGLDSNTFVVLTSDNGPNKEFDGSAFPLKGAKGTSYEGGARVPCIMRWPGQIDTSKVSNTPISIIDILPTFTKLAGGSVPLDRTIDGKDLSPLLADIDNVDQVHENIYFFRGSKIVGIRVGDWKYKVTNDNDISKSIELSPSEKLLSKNDQKLLIQHRVDSILDGEDKIEELFNLNGDIGESNNVIALNTTLADSLKTLMDDFGDEVKKNARPDGISTITSTKEKIRYINSQYSIYPNPISNNTFIIEAEVRIKHLDIKNELGKTILSLKTNDNKEVKIPNLSSGAYIITPYTYDEEAIIPKRVLIR